MNEIKSRGTQFRSWGKWNDNFGYQVSQIGNKNKYY